MAKAKLPHAKNWRERNIDDWNATTFFNYLCDQHRIVRGIDYITKTTVKMDMILINQVYKKYGRLETKNFIDKCLKDYNGTAQYKICTFWFMRTYMLAQVMPQVQEGIKRTEDIQNALEENLDDLTF
ncbi:hypothetical protein P4L29_22790 [Bacillus cereus]|nr:hypothetical protein [Bacillus cereus]